MSSNFPLLRQTLPALRSWVENEALPFWATVGFDSARGGFHERLDLKGKPILDVPKRLMVQGRQLYVYCHSGLLGWYPESHRLAEDCVQYMLSAFYRRDGKPGWIHSLAPDGSVASGVRDTYAHAFVLLGLAWYYRFTGDSQVLKIIDETLAFLDESVASPRGGYLDAVPRPDLIRRQNPHMHLFEGFIALFQATRNAQYLARGVEIFEVFSSRFFQPDRGWLCEYLTEDLVPLPGQRGRISEPGHHYEWIWLLRQFERASGHNVASYCKALYDHADRYGWDEKGFIVDEVESIGTVLKGSRRTWPHTEALKANIVEGEAGRPGCDRKAAQCVLRLMDTYMGRPVTGGWIDHVDESGQPAVTMIPASTLYHVFCGTAEAVRAASTKRKVSPHPMMS
jgi:mannose/cellobiose epimerase-like protein (N-acyl-D-glucosamine 2-epimerase family)